MNKMRLKGLVDEDFVNYKVPSMFIVTCFCDFKCEKEDKNNITFCQNSTLAKTKIVEVSIPALVERYCNNPITRAVVFGGMEPFSQFEEMREFIKELRKVSNDTVVIYTGYNEDEIMNDVSKLVTYKNIIIKYGRYKCNVDRRYDEILGVYLSSNNQYARYYS